jgi:hypothetical protein
VSQQKKSPNYDDLIFDFQSLVFLLENNPDLLMDLSIEQQRFKQLFSAEEIRSEFYVNQVQPVLSSSGLNNGQVNIKILQDALGDRLFIGLINLTDSYFFHLEATDQSLRIMYEKLRQTAKELFPDEGFIKFKLVVSD